MEELNTAHTADTVTHIVLHLSSHGQELPLSIGPSALDGNDAIGPSVQLEETFHVSALEALDGEEKIRRLVLVLTTTTITIIAAAAATALTALGTAQA
jgi:hypothetical protein